MGTESTRCIIKLVRGSSQQLAFLEVDLPPVLNRGLHLDFEVLQLVVEIDWSKYGVHETRQYTSPT